METHRLIQGATYGPEALKAICHAFETAWTEIAANYGDDPGDVEAGRTRLAYAVLAVADESSRDAEALKQAALTRLASDYQKSRGGIG